MIAPPVIRAAILAVVLCALSVLPAWAQSPPPEVEYLGPGEGNVERYRITILPGSSLWAVAIDRLPLKALDEGDKPTFELLEQSFHKTFPDREITQVYPGESFVLEVAAGTFVSQSVEATPDEVRYTSFNGDHLVHYLRNPNMVYRLIRKDKPNEAEVLLSGEDANPEELARDVYQVEQPDFLQVRRVRELLSHPNTRVTVNLEKRYLDEFRNYRDRAIRVDEGENGLKVYLFSEAQADVPFLRVDDAIGDSIDAATFPRVFRVEYYKDGTVKKFLITQPGDLLAVLRQPDNVAWARLYHEWDTWQDGEASALEPFAPSTTSIGSLLPGRILALTYRPKVSQSSSSGIECFGIPLVLLLGGLALARKR